MEEYILEQLNVLETEKQKNTIRLQELARSEMSINEEIKNISESPDADLELFSPRIAAEQGKDKISDLKHQLEDIQFQQMQVNNEIEQLEMKIEKFHKLLLDARKKVEIQLPDSEKPDTSCQTDEMIRSDSLQETSSALSEQDYTGGAGSDTEELEIILKKIEKCLNLIHTDKLKCKNELKNLRYYLRALIAQKKQQ